MSKLAGVGGSLGSMAHAIGGVVDSLAGTSGSITSPRYAESSPGESISSAVTGSTSVNVDNIIARLEVLTGDLKDLQESLKAKTKLRDGFQANADKERAKASGLTDNPEAQKAAEAAASVFEASASAYQREIESIKSKISAKEAEIVNLKAQLPSAATRDAENAEREQEAKQPSAQSASKGFSEEDRVEAANSQVGNASRLLGIAGVIASLPLKKDQ